MATVFGDRLYTTKGKGQESCRVSGIKNLMMPMGIHSGKLFEGDKNVMIIALD